MRRFLKLIYLLFPLVFAGCNSEIFVNPVDDIVDSISLSGDNGTATFRIQKEGLVSVDFDNNVDYDAFATYFDGENEIVGSHFDISKVTRILYNSHTFALEFNVRDDKVEIVALDNANGDEIEVRAFLNYGYTTKSVTIHVGQGRPLQIDFLGHDTLRPIVEIVEKTGRRRYTNDSDHAIRVLYYPYRDVKSSITLIPEESWTDGVSGTIPLPAYIDGEWNDYCADEVEVTIGSETWFTSAVTPNAEQLIEIPAYSTAVIELTVTVATLDTRYSSNISLPNSQLMWISSGRWQQTQPIGYQVNIYIEE